MNKSTSVGVKWFVSILHFFWTAWSGKCSLVLTNLLAGSTGNTNVTSNY